MSRADELEGAAKAREEKAAEDIHRWVGAGYSVMDPATDFAWTIRYKNVAINSGLPDSLFRYDPRPGEARVDEIDMSEGWAQVARE
jgi:outer membrane lipoprotein-sorting protein